MIRAEFIRETCSFDVVGEKLRDFLYKAQNEYNYKILSVTPVEIKPLSKTTSKTGFVVVYRDDEKKYYKDSDLKPIIISWRLSNPDGIKIQCHRDTGISRPTIDKYWDCINKEEINE